MLNRPRLAAVLAALAAALVVTGSAAPRRNTSSPLPSRLARALAVPGVSAARSAAFAIDLRTGAVVFARNATKPLAPASVEKLAVTYAALVALGPSFRFHTELLARGERSGATWRGDLILRGYGDPTLTTSDLRALASRLRSTGIRAVSGRIIGDESFFDSRRTVVGWKPSYYLNECPALSALVVDRGVDRRGRLTRTPATLAAATLKRILNGAGVAVGGRAVSTSDPAAGRLAPITAVTSPPLWKVLRFMDHESDNFTAELVIKQLGALIGRAGTTAAGAAVVRQLLSADGVPLEGVRIADGSGLSLRDRLTTRALAGLLEAAWSSPTLRRGFLAVLPVAGRNGTLDGRLRSPSVRGKVEAKTGTTSISSALAGYVKGRYAFSIIHNGSPVNSWRARTAQDRFVTVLASAS